MVEISVVTTVYNGAPYIDRSVPSILGQTHADFEWVIVDDGSSDDTAPFLADLARKDRRVRILSPGRLGRAKALNLAVETARGAYVVQQDFDDVSYPGRLEAQAGFLDAHPEVGLVGSHYLRVDEIRGERYVRRPPARHEEIVRAMAKNIPFAHTMVTFRKQAWREAGGYPAALAMIDFRMFIAMARSGWRLANMTDVLGEHYVYADSFWHKHLRYDDTQKQMIVLQMAAIRQLQLPPWMMVYPLGRSVYRYLPVSLKRFTRRHLARAREDDL